MDRSTLVRIEFAVAWEHDGIQYRDRNVANKINFWRDFFPGQLGERLEAVEAGTLVSQSFPAGELVPPYSSSQCHKVPDRKFSRRFGRARIEPRLGRFYPQGVIAGATGGFAQDWRPFRLVGIDGDRFIADLNHPLARFPLTVSGQVLDILAHEKEERGGSCHDIAEFCTGKGPGMQVPLEAGEADWYDSYPLSRMDSRGDEQFYREPRLVQHIDSHAIQEVKDLHARLLTPDMRILDLMSSWTTHLPEAFSNADISGLGMNAAELEQNPMLRERAVHDLNTTPTLPYADAQFDAVICAMSVEYMTQPLDVFREVARVLKPGGLFINTFSERWFPTKVIDLWTDLHPFERLGLVIDYYRRAGGFTDLHAETVRGYPRPEDDQYANMAALSDPIYAVWGRVS